MNWLQRIFRRTDSARPEVQPYDPAKFKNGSTVRISPRSQLEEFLRTWKYHHPLQPEQLEFSGHIAKVQASYMYHGGDVIYQLEGIPGIWHEQLLQPVPRDS